MSKEISSQIVSFEQKIREQEDQLFGISLFFQGITYTYTGNESIIKKNKYHYERIMRRGKVFISKAKELLKLAKLNPDNAKLIKQIHNFKFPPISGNPMLDGLTKRAQFLVEKYNELFPERPREKPLTQEEYYRLSNVVVNEF